MYFHRNFSWILLITALLGAQIATAQTTDKNQAQHAPGKSDTADNRIAFLLLKFFKDSSTQQNKLVLLDKIIKPGTMKSSPRTESLINLPYLSTVYYKNNVPVDSTRSRYPLRERLQNTKATAEGYKDIDVSSREFFIRFQQGSIDRVKIFEISFSDKKELIAIDL
jgi:hypothetical protein